MWLHGHMLREPGALGSDLSLPVFEFCDLGILFPSSLSGLSPVTCGGGQRGKDGVPGTTAGLLVPGTWAGAQPTPALPSIPWTSPPSSGTSCCFGSVELCKEFASLLSWGSSRHRHLSCRWVDWLLVAGSLRSGKLRSTNSFLCRVGCIRSAGKGTFVPQGVR